MTIEFVKWAATVTLIVSVGLNGLGIYPLGPLVQIVGGLLWTVASMKMKDTPLIVTNVVMTLVGIIAIGYRMIAG
jgi:hypothetical protein